MKTIDAKEQLSFAHSVMNACVKKIKEAGEDIKALSVTAKEVGALLDSYICANNGEINA
jgi:hypothetical protein